jgi:hypothetical protein
MTFKLSVQLIFFMPVWFGVEEPIGSFTGRTTELETLHDLLTEKSKISKPTVINQSSTIYGLGGIGKSELARAYAWKYFEFYQGNAI